MSNNKEKTESKRTPEPPKLVFEPDQRKAAQIAFFRRLLLWITIVILGVGLVLITRYRPAPFRSADSGQDSTGLRPSPSGVPLPVLPADAPQARRAAPEDEVSRSVSRFRTETGAALRNLRRYGEGAPAEQIAADNAARILEKVHGALALLDSAKTRLAAAESAADYIERSVRALTGDKAYRLSVLHAKADAYLSLVKDEANSQTEILEALAASARAALAGDPDEAVVKQNAATGLLRRLESRQKNRERRAREFDGAVQRYYR